MTVLTAFIYKEEEMFIATCPQIGTVSQGYTIEEALTNLKEATTLYLEEFPLKEVSPSPLLATFEIEVAESVAA